MSRSRAAPKSRHEQRCRPAGQPNRPRICVDVIAEGRCDCEPEREPEAEEKPDCQLLGTVS